MKNKISIIFEDKIAESLRKIFKDDDEAIKKFILKAIDNELKKYADEKTASEKNADGLENYLKSGTVGSRDYGIKGQGW
jgi:hypothetical protein